VQEDDNDNDNAKAGNEPTISLDAHRGLRAQKETDRRRGRSAVSADQDAVRERRALLERQLFAGPATSWQQAADKASYLLRQFAATGEGRDPRYKQMIEDALRDFQRLSTNLNEPTP
jgi:hypothetical protein